MLYSVVPERILHYFINVFANLIYYPRTLLLAHFGPCHDIFQNAESELMIHHHDKVVEYRVKNEGDILKLLDDFFNEMCSLTILFKSYYLS